MLSGNVTHLVAWQMEIYMVYIWICIAPNDFKGFCLKWDLVLKFKLYKVTASVGLPLAEHCEQRKFCGEHLATALRHCSSKTSKHISKMQCGTVMKDFRAVLGRMSPWHPEGLAWGHVWFPFLQ